MDSEQALAVHSSMLHLLTELLLELVSLLLAQRNSYRKVNRHQILSWSGVGANPFEIASGGAVTLLLVGSK